MKLFGMRNWLTDEGKLRYSGEVDRIKQRLADIVAKALMFHYGVPEHNKYVSAYDELRHITTYSLEVLVLDADEKKALEKFMFHMNNLGPSKDVGYIADHAVELHEALKNEV